MVLNLLVKHWITLCLVSFKILHLFQQLNFKPFQHIIIIYSVVFNFCYEMATLLLKYVLFNSSKSTIVVAPNCRSNFAIKQDS